MALPHPSRPVAPNQQLSPANPWGWQWQVPELARNPDEADIIRQHRAQLLLERLERLGSESPGSPSRHSTPEFTLSSLLGRADRSQDTPLGRSQPDVAEEDLSPPLLQAEELHQDTRGVQVLGECRC